MLLLNGLQHPIEFIAFLFALVAAVTVHEFMHAFVADRLGDPTPRMAGRLTPNPLVHLDPLGSIMLLLAGFGWGKPVMINPRNFANPIIDELLVALAGPASNLVQAVIAGYLARTFAFSAPILASVCVLIVQLNVFLMLFNLIPIPPLDGSKVLRLILDETTFRMLELSSMPLLIGLFVLIQATPLGTLLTSTSNHLTTWLLGG
jgi:Zn-dependent protease